MPGMMHSRVSGRGVWCDCCSAWTATRAIEKRGWERDWDDEQRSEDFEYAYAAEKARWADLLERLID